MTADDHDDLSAPLADLADQADTSTAWPAASLGLAGRAGALGWGIPPELGGLGLGRVAHLEATERLASACLTTAFILSQREAAVRWLLQAQEPVRRRYLPGLAQGELFSTVGLSQLTTSRQHRTPSLRATALPSGGYRLDGEIPWVTGADHADALVVGAAVDDKQAVLLLPARQAGVSVGPPLPLAALTGSRTAQVRCDAALVPADHVLAGPAEKVVRTGGGLDTSCLALGLAGAAVAYLHDEASRRPDVRPAADRFADTAQAARRRLHSLAESGAPAAEDVLALRVECTRLVLRASQAALAVAKGAGFVVPHPAQRWARQGQFFLVWSCPQPVASAVLADLAAL